MVAGTASAVSGRVQRRQAEKYAQRDAEAAAGGAPAYQGSQPAEQPTPSQTDVIQQLKDLAELHAQGVLTDEEFAVQKSKLLNG